MGCQTSRGEPEPAAPLPQERRRLSVTYIFGQDVAARHTASCSSPSSSHSRGLVNILSQEAVIDLLKGNDMRYSMCSETDEQLGGMANFGQKKVSKNGFCSDGVAEELPDMYGFGYACHKGKKPESPNQDSWFMLQVEGNFSIYGVFDGHGQGGHYISNFVKENLPKLLVRDERLRSDEGCSACLRDAFLTMQGMIQAASEKAPIGEEPLTAGLAGTTATVAVHDHKACKLTVAHVGDSGACLGTVAPSGQDKMTVTRLTQDHKPSLAAEKARIEKAGGKVVFDGYANHRVFIKGTTLPGLNMSRCLGDLVGHDKAGITSMPDVSEHMLGPKDKLLLLCSDGVWEFMPPEEVVELVWPHGAANASVAAEALAQEAWNRWMSAEGGKTVDDITALIVFLRSEVQI